VTESNVLVDARGVLCPVPIIRLARAASARPPGTVLELLTDDPAAQLDVPAWCHLRGHELVSAGPAEPTDELPPAPTRTEPEPDAPNRAPGQVVRHVIRLAQAPAGAGHPG
jgi:tRNA 2-thiouridine synthesizing protein A